MDGTSVPYVLESTSDRFSVRIGDPNTTIRGGHTYTLRYVVHGGLSYPKGQGIELYWNVTGNEWQVPIRVVEATLHDPDGLFRSVRSCYRGTFGSTSGSCATTLKQDGSVGFRTTALMQNEGITIAQSLDVTKVLKDVREQTKMFFILVPLGLIGLIYGGFRIYRHKTAYRTDAPIIPQYEPYPGMRPMYTGLLMDGKLDPRDITACIVYLAEQGYLKIRKVDGKKYLVLFKEHDDYEFTLMRDPKTLAGQFESSVLSLIFKTEGVVDDTITLSQIQSNQQTLTIAYWNKNDAKIRMLEKKLNSDLISSGFFEVRPTRWTLLIFVSLLTATGLLYGGFVAMVSIICAVAFFAGVIFTYIRRTVKGYETLEYLKGFKLFLETTERDRYTFHNAPEKNPEQFMEYLPYAIAFGVEEKWAKLFGTITIPNPGWYDGGSIGSFSAVNLASSLGAFSTAFASSSSGASTASGGGSSGGGSGGGGGGSW